MQSTPTKRTRRLHAPELKRQVVTACQQPGTSISGVALAHGLNANLVRRWLKQEESPKHGALTVKGQDSGAFVAVPMAGIQTSAPEPIRLELRRGASTVSLQWPASGAAECGAWLREWLR
jgi:transposase